MGAVIKGVLSSKITGVATLVFSIVWAVTKAATQAVALWWIERKIDEQTALLRKQNQKKKMKKKGKGTGSTKRHAVPKKEDTCCDENCIIQ